jgi:preprotein translocase subunit SecA
MFKKLARFRQYIDGLSHGSVEHDLTPYQKLLDQIAKINLTAVEDGLLQQMSRDLIDQARNGIPLDELLVQAYALVRETSRRVIGLHPFDVQVIAGIAMHQGKLVEMQTGEGKTLAAVFPAYLNALTGQGVHVLTFNDYLARRDAEWMGPVYRFLGLTVGFVREDMSRSDRRAAYDADITYVTAKEAGFDHLRGFLCYEKNELPHRPFHFAIVDEADSILIDEARIPLVIAGNVDLPEMGRESLAGIVRNLTSGLDYETDEYARNISLTESGLRRVETRLGCGNLYAAKNFRLLTELNSALHAEMLLKRDIDYIVRGGKVELVDEFTGRVAGNRHWPDGLQAALEAKEGLTVQTKGKILGSMTLQHFIQSYPKLSGMTATAQPAAEEVKDFYNLDVVVIPPNRPCIRIDHPDLVFTHKEAKYLALLGEIATVHATGRPILVGTCSVEESDHLAGLLHQVGIACEVLNAKTDELEARIIARAGQPGAVTISTNMAGRGTDIHLGGSQEEEREQVAALGGLYVIGTNRHESRRIDNQLRGRAGRQGDPGSTRFMISLEDDLIVRYGIWELIPPERRPGRQNEPSGDPLIRDQIARAQRIIEGQNFEARRTLWQYSWLVERQRRIIHQRRQDALLDREPLTFLAAKAPKRYQKLLPVVGIEVLQRVEKQITLFQIDACWADYLDEIAQIREGIHLVRFAGLIPLEEFTKLASEAFQRLLRRIDDRIIATFKSAVITEAGLDLEQAGLARPTSTWTYLVTDNPFGGSLGIFLSGFRGAGAGLAVAGAPLLFWIAILARFLGRRKGRR